MNIARLFLKRLRLVIVLAAIALPALADDVAEAKLTALLSNKNTFVSDFEQISLSADGTRSQRQTGRIVISRPNKFRWQVNEPIPQLIISDAEEIYAYDELLEQVTISPLHPEKLDTPALLLSGNTAAIHDSFHVLSQHYGDTTEFTLTPKASDNIFHTLILRFNHQNLSSMEISDSFGQRSIIAFLNSHINTTVTEQEFRFIIPDNVDIFRSETGF